MKPDPKRPKPKLRECLPYIEQRTEEAGFTGRVILDFLHGTFMHGEFDEKVSSEEMVRCQK